MGTPEGLQQTRWDSNGSYLQLRTDGTDIEMKFLPDGSGSETSTEENLQVSMPGQGELLEDKLKIMPRPPGDLGTISIKAVLVPRHDLI